MVYLKKIKYYLFYIFLFFFLSNQFDYQSLIAIFYQPHLNSTLFLFFIMIRCLWAHYIFQWINLYQQVYEFIRFRVSFQKYSYFCLLKLLYYAILFILINMILCFVLFRQIPTFLIVKCTLIDVLSFYFCLYFYKTRIIFIHH